MIAIRKELSDAEMTILTTYESDVLLWVLQLDKITRTYIIIRPHAFSVVRFGTYGVGHGAHETPLAVTVQSPDDGWFASEPVKQPIDNIL